jgi:type VI secretion system protein ImpJ
MPQYDHENLGSCFDEVIRAIEELLRLRGPRAFEKVYFEREQQWLQAALEPAWLSPTRRLFLGVETDLEHDDCVGLLLSTRTKKSLLDIKMGSAVAVKEIFRQALRGLNLVPISIPPSELPRGRGVVYFKIEQDKVFWKNVAETGLLAVMVNSNHSPFKDDRTVVVTTAGDFKGKELRFALFIIEQK